MNIKNLKIMGNGGSAFYGANYSSNSLKKFILQSENLGLRISVVPIKSGNFIACEQKKVKINNDIFNLELKDINSKQFKIPFEEQCNEQNKTILTSDKSFYELYKENAKTKFSLMDLESIRKNILINKSLLINFDLKNFDSKDKIKISADFFESLSKFKNPNLFLESSNYYTLMEGKAYNNLVKAIMPISNFKDINDTNVDQNIDGISINYLNLNKNILNFIIENNLKLYVKDDINPIGMLNQIIKLLNSYTKETETEQLYITLITDFPEKVFSLTR